jgi:hypothetical protein
MAESAETLRNWRGLYKAALFETDASKIPSRIEEARRALVFRSRELFETSPNYDGETETIENALYAPASIGKLFEIGYKRPQTGCPSWLNCSQITITSCRSGQDCGLLTIRGVDKLTSVLADLFEDHTSPPGVSWFRFFSRMNHE